MSGNSLRMIAIDSLAAAVLNVTSAQGRPPAHSACANGFASFASSNTTTGKIPIFEISSNTLFIV